VCVDRHAAHDNDASASLDFVEFPLEVTVECRVAASLCSDPPWRKTSAANLEQDGFQRCNVLQR
jgi:hypothetical protein